MTPLRTLTLFALGAVVALFVLPAAAAAPTPEHQLTVDGTTYAPTKVTGSGPTVHYYTPGTPSPTTAFSERHQWTGNGREHLPCTGQIHWIDNANLLTISHCEEVPPETTTTTTTAPEPTTTTTEPPPTTTTTSEPPTTTTTVPPTTTTSEPPSTTTTSEATTTTSPQTTTTEPVNPSCEGEACELPYTGVPVAVFALSGLAALVLGAATVWAAKE